MADFEDIYKRYAPQICRICMGYTNDADEAKDLMQETFILVWKNLHTFQNRSKLSTWIFRIATNTCLRAIEKTKRIPLTALPPELPDHVEDSPEEKLSFLYRCIAELEETDRIIITLELEELPQAEIAAIVGISHGNLRVKVHRIKEKLTQKFKHYEQFN